MRIPAPVAACTTLLVGISDPGKTELSAEIERIDPNHYRDDGGPAVVRRAERTALLR